VILRFYRSNQTVVQLALPLIVSVLWSLRIAFPFPVEALPDHSVFSWVPDLPPYKVRIIEALVVLLEALLFNKLINDLELFERVSFVPGLVYVFCAFMLIPDADFRWVTFSNLFLLPFLRLILVVYRQPDVREESFWAGLSLGVAFCFSWTLAPLLLCGWIMMMVLKTVNWREWMMMIFGMLFPMALVQVIHYGMYGNWSALLSEQHHLQIRFFLFGDDRAAMICWLLLLLMTIAGFFSMLSRQSRSVIKIRRQRQVIMFLVVFLIGIALFSNGLFGGHPGVLLVIPVSFLVSYLVVHSNVTWISDFMLYGTLLFFLLSRVFPTASF